jgi:hypothetical protein
MRGTTVQWPLPNLSLWSIVPWTTVWVLLVGAAVLTVIGLVLLLRVRGGRR